MTACQIQALQPELRPMLATVLRPIGAVGQVDAIAGFIEQLRSENGTTYEMEGRRELANDLGFAMARFVTAEGHKKTAYSRLHEFLTGYIGTYCARSCERTEEYLCDMQLRLQHSVAWQKAQEYFDDHLTKRFPWLNPEKYQMTTRRRKRMDTAYRRYLREIGHPDPDSWKNARKNRWRPHEPLP